MPDHAWAESNLTISVLALTQSRCGYAGTNHQMSHCHSSKIDISILMGLRCQLVQKKSDLEEKQQEGYNSISRFIAELSVRHLQRWSMFKKKKKIVPFPLGAIDQILCQFHDDIQHQARPLSLFQDMWTKSFEKKLRSPSVQSCFAANCLPRSQSIFQPKQAVFLCCSRCSDVSNSAMPLFIKGTHDAFKLV